MKKVTLKLENGCSKPWEKLDDWQKSAHKYRATLIYDGRQMTIDFFTGSGWTKEPIWKDVLGSLVSDYYCFESADSFEDFCNELGYDSDNRKAKDIYKQIEKQSKKLTVLLGEDLEEICILLQKEGY